MTNKYAAPWNTLDDPRTACSSCHIGGEPIAHSQAIALLDTKTRYLAGKTYAFVIQFESDERGIAGMLAIANGADGGGGIMIRGCSPTIRTSMASRCAR